jgi:Subtilase family
MRRRPMLEHPATVLAAHPIAPPGRPSVLSTAVLLAITLAASLILMTRGGDLQPTAAHAPAPKYAHGQILVKWDLDTDHATKLNLRNKVHATRIDVIEDLDVNVWRVPRGTEQAAVSALAHNPRVAYAERDALAIPTSTTPDDPSWPQQTVNAQLHASTAWDITRGSSDVTVAVVDTGFALGLPDMAGRFVTGRDFIDGDSVPADPNSQSHGAMVAGVIGAASNNSLGVAGWCWNCQILPLRVCDASTYCPYSAMASAITFAADRGARVINVSLGGSASSSALDSAVTYAANHGAIVVAAAGNDGCDCKSYPAASPGALAVGGTDSTGTALYSGSNRGSWVDVAAPVGSVTTWSNGQYWPFGGTSSSTPVVSGILALEVSARPDATVADLGAALEARTAPVAGVATGLVDGASAVNAILGSQPTPPASPTVSPTSAATTSPSPTPTSSPSPTPTSSASEPQPTPTPTTQSFDSSGSLTAKVTSASFAIACGNGPLASQLTFGKKGSLSLSVGSSVGTLASAIGSSPVSLSTSVTAGAYRVTVTGKTSGVFKVHVICAT